MYAYEYYVQDGNKKFSLVRNCVRRPHCYRISVSDFVSFDTIFTQPTNRGFATNAIFIFSHVRSTLHNNIILF